MAYYYLISSLPMLKADGDMPISYERFIEMCQDSVGDSKLDILKNLNLESNKGPLISEWTKFYSNFKDELTYMRNQRLGRKTLPPDKRDEHTSRAIDMAMKDTNPLNAEQTLLSLQFKNLDELIGIHYFDDYALFGYALKLKLLERKKIFDKKNGKAEFDRVVNKLEEQILSME